MFGDLPATGFFVRHARNVDISRVEVRTLAPDARPSFWMQDVEGARLSGLKLPRQKTGFQLEAVKDFELRDSAPIRDRRIAETRLHRF